MKEIFEFRINYDFATRLFDENEGRDIGESVKIVKITREDPRFLQIAILDNEINKNFNRGFYFGWKMFHEYSKNEIDSAPFLKLCITNFFEPSGEECETQYDESSACEICGANRTQVGVLKLNKGSVPKKDISSTMAGEIVVSENFYSIYNKYNLSGLSFEPVMMGNAVSNFYQLKVNSSPLDLTKKTVTGVSPFNLSQSDKSENYQCPNGHTLGLNILSEVYVASTTVLGEYDFFSTKQMVGVKRGVLRPQSLHLCSQHFRQMVKKEKLTGFDFEVAHIDDD